MRWATCCDSIPLGSSMCSAALCGPSLVFSIFLPTRLPPQRFGYSRRTSPLRFYCLKFRRSETMIFWLTKVNLLKIEHKALES